MTPYALRNNRRIRLRLTQHLEVTVAPYATTDGYGYGYASRNTRRLQLLRTPHLSAEKKPGELEERMEDGRGLEHHQLCKILLVPAESKVTGDPE